MALMSAGIIGFLQTALCDSWTHRQQVVFGEMKVDLVILGLLAWWERSCFNAPFLLADSADCSADVGRAVTSNVMAGQGWKSFLMAGFFLTMDNFWVLTTNWRSNIAPIFRISFVTQTLVEPQDALYFHKTATDHAVPWLPDFVIELIIVICIVIVKKKKEENLQICWWRKVHADLKEIKS